MDKIDDGCIPTFSKYVKEQLIGAIVKYIKNGDTSAFTEDFDSRKIIESIGVNNFKQALLEHIVKLDAAFNIVNTRAIIEYGKNYNVHTVGETELRLYETLSLSVTDVFNNHAIHDAEIIINKEGMALYNLAKSFVDFRYVKAKKKELDTMYMQSEDHKRIIWKIEEYFKKLST